MSILEQTKSVEQLKQEMGPLKASQILRQTKVEQCQYIRHDGEGRYCALGAIALSLGWDGKGHGTIHAYHEPSNFDEIETKLRSLLGNDSDFQGVSGMNNQGMTFEQIADELEEMGY